MSKLQELIARLCPNGVPFKPLGEVCEIKGRIGFRGYTRKDIVPEGQGAISLSPSNITDYTIDYNDSTYISWEKYEESPEIKVYNNDVIFTKTASVGKCAIIKNLPCEATINPQLVVLKNILTSPDYLNYILQDSRFQYEVKKLTGIGSVPNISQSALAGIKIPVPPIEVQEEIVKILDRFADYAAELQAELQARKEQYEYYRNLLLTFNPSACGYGTDGEQEIDVTTWGGWKLQVEWKPMGEIAINHDKRRKPITASKRIAGIYPYYGASGIVDYVDGYIFDGEYLLISEDGANLLARTTPIAFAIKGKNWVNNHAHVLEFESKTTQRFVEFYINMIDISKYVSGGAQPKLNQENLNSILIPIPPLELQEKIVAILDRFEALVNDLTQGLPAEIAAVKEQYEYYRNKLLTFKQAA